MTALQAVYLRVTTTGAPGSAAGSATTAVPGALVGLLYAVYVVPTASGWAATTDVTVTETSTGKTLLTVTDKSSAPAEYPVRLAEVDPTGAPTGSVCPPALAAGQVTVTLTQANAQDPAAAVWLYVLQ